MKKYLTLVLLALQTLTSQAQDKSKNMEENFSLEGALAMFKKSNSIEEFEASINSEKNEVNNLDLNQDGTIDYIAVEDLVDGDKHTLVLAAVLSENEKQDVATLVIEKTANEEAQLQIFGDEDLFEANTIVEPFEVNEQMDKRKNGPNMPELTTTRIVVNVWFWPSVRFIYAPSYRIWVSPYRWAFYPKWWKPWRPVHYTVFVGRVHVHKTFFHRTNNRRVVIHSGYGNHRHRSTAVIKRGKGTTIIHKGRGGRVKGVHIKGRR